MNEMTDWSTGNQRYLTAALAWLRLLLERQAGRHPTALIVPPGSWTTPPSAAPAPTPRRLRFFGRPATAPATPASAPAQESASPPAQEPILLAAPAHSSIEQQVVDAAARMREAEAMQPPPALLLLAQQLNLSPFEREVLLLCAAMELDTRIPTLCARAQDDPKLTYPTFALALALFDDAAWDVLSPEGGLRHWRLIEITQPSGQPLTTNPLRADERIVNYINGLNYVDDRLSPLLAPLALSADTPELAPSQRRAVDRIAQNWAEPLPGSPFPLVQLLGTDTPSKQLVAAHAAAAPGLHLYRMPAELLPQQAGDLETFARLWQRETVLLRAALFLDAQEVESGAASEAQRPQLTRFLTRTDGVFFLSVREIWTGMGRANVAVDVGRPTPSEQRSAWADALGAEAGDSPALLAGQFNLDLTAINRIAQARSGADETPVHERLWDACLASTRPRMDALAQRLEPKATWDDIVLPAAEDALLHRIADQVAQRTKVYEEWGFSEKMSRGWGINALFAGPSGTGKTMAAEVIANHLRLNLYRIDLSAVVSKYIGETEDNLRRLFDAAEDGGAILLFDEADALYGKRTEVKDSHDRYANIEISYLLQRMEAYRGLAILTTNMKNALDTAFLRRLRFIVNFPFPGLPERVAIWQKVFPEQTLKADLDFGRLARLPATGGMIHNIALNAAFAAAHAGTRVTMPQVLDAARAEFQKLEQPVPDREFAWQEAVATAV